MEKKAPLAPLSTVATLSTKGGHVFNQFHTHAHVKASMAALHAGKGYDLGHCPNLVKLTNHHYFKSQPWNKCANQEGISSETPLTLANETSTPTSRQAISICSGVPWMVTMPQDRRVVMRKQKKHRQDLSGNCGQQRSSSFKFQQLQHFHFFFSKVD